MTPADDGLGLARRGSDEVVAGRRLAVLDEIAAPDFTPATRPASATSDWRLCTARWSRGRSRRSWERTGRSSWINSLPPTGS